MEYATDSPFARRKRGRSHAFSSSLFTPSQGREVTLRGSQDPAGGMRGGMPGKKPAAGAGSSAGCAVRTPRRQSSFVTVPVPVNLNSVALLLMFDSVTRKVSLDSTVVSPLMVTVKVLLSWPAGIDSPTSDFAT